jgi:hypothetical protein
VLENGPQIEKQKAETKEDIFFFVGVSASASYFESMGNLDYSGLHSKTRKSIKHFNCKIFVARIARLNSKFCDLWPPSYNP